MPDFGFIVTRCPSVATFVTRKDFEHNQHYPLFPIVDLFRISKKGRKEINKWNEASKSFIDSNTFVNARDSMDERESGWWIVLWIERENRRERWWIRHGLPSFEIRGQIYNGHGITNFTVAKICSDTPIRLAIDKRLGYPRCPQHQRVFALEHIPGKLSARTPSLRHHLLFRIRASLNRNVWRMNIFSV